MNVTWIFIPVVAGLLAGCILYWFRCRTPCLLWARRDRCGSRPSGSRLRQTSYLLLEEDSPFFTGALEQTIGVFAAIYLIIHGLNNVEKDLPSKWRDVWDRTFHPGREKARSEPP